MTARQHPPLRCLLGGVGARGRHWARYLADDPATALVAGADPSPEARDWLRTELGLPSEGCFDDVSAMLERVEADVLVLATPPMERLAHCRAAFERGLRVLAEKPLTVDLGEAAAIVRAAPEERQLRVAMNFRFMPVHLEHRRLLREAGIGAPGFARFVYWRNRDGRRPGINKYPLTMDQPMLLEQSIHHFDTFRFVYGSEIVAVSARTANPPWSMYRDDATVLATFDFANGSLLEYTGTWAGRTPLHEHHWRTDCAGGVIYQREQWGDLSLLRGGEPGPLGAEPVEEPVPLPAWHALYDDARALWRAFVAELRGDAIPPDQPAVPTGRDHLVSLAVAFACLESSREGRRVELPAFIARHGIAELVAAAYPSAAAAERPR